MPIETLDGLIEGYKTFRQDHWEKEVKRWKTLRVGQNPKFMIISCSDSRVEPSTIFNGRPGEFFTVRNVANLVPAFENDEGQHGVSAALEFAVTQLEVPNIIVMGHGSCGGVKACYCNAFEGQPTGKGAFIRNWVSQLNPVREKIKSQNHDTEDKALKAMELETVRLSLNNLMSFPFVKARVESGHLKLHGAYFAIEDGVLHMIDDMGAFKPVEYFDK